MNGLTITACPRSGTAYVAALLQACGIDCGHERHQAPARISPFLVEGEIPEGAVESSWLAAPQAGVNGGPVVHLRRHPLAVVQSLVGFGFFGARPRQLLAYAEYAKLHAPRAFENENPVQAACELWVDWNRLIERQALFALRDDALFQVEQLDEGCVLTMLRLIGVIGEPAANDALSQIVRVVLADVPKDTNHRHRATSIRWGDLSPELHELAVEYGYAEEPT